MSPRQVAFVVVVTVCAFAAGLAGAFFRALDAEGYR